MIFIGGDFAYTSAITKAVKIKGIGEKQPVISTHQLRLCSNLSIENVQFDHDGTGSKNTLDATILYVSGNLKNISIRNCTFMFSSVFNSNNMGAIHLQNAAINLLVEGCTFNKYGFNTTNWCIWGTFRGDGAGNYAEIKNNVFAGGGVCLEGGGDYKDIRIENNKFNGWRSMRITSNDSFSATIDNVYIEHNTLSSLDLSYCTAVTSASNIYFRDNKNSSGNAATISGGCDDIKAAIIKE